MHSSTLKIVVTGPESSGKTTLAADLAAALGTVWVPEFARTYLAYLGRPYEHKDLKTICLGQFAWETWYHEAMLRKCADVMMPRPVLICDTDWTVIHVWEAYKFGSRSVALSPSPLAPHSSSVYLLCLPDIPWQPDPLREHPEERNVLFEMYENLLRDMEARYIIVRGNPEQRLQTALAAIREIL